MLLYFYFTWLFSKKKTPEKGVFANFFYLGANEQGKTRSSFH